MSIPIGISGRVTNSDRDEHFVRVEDDTSNTGGFLIFEQWRGSAGPNANGSFDSWVEDRQTLERLFKDAGWQVQWSTP
jgi:hypothetical protein